MNYSNKFIKLSFVVIFVFSLLSALTFVLAAFLSIEIFRIIFVIIAFFLIFFLMLLFIGFGIINKILNKGESYNVQQNISPLKKTLIYIALKVFMPFIITISNFFNYNKDQIRRVYIKASNEYVLSLNIKVVPEELLVILPHCLQSSKCSYRIRNNLKECHQCGLCNISDIKALVEKYAVKVGLATGGTAARKTIKDLKPEFVIAVACERDLTAGIMDVKGLPVYGILNQRPNGPCKDTLVDIEELETMIKHFIN
ncbi:MAG TPA: DUF116 domain-containing protein [Thermoclostridium sp.]|nr:DUF116 domain-containing protein [Thermoclostridium sp.]